MESHEITPPRERLILNGKIHRYPVEKDKHGSKSGAYCIYTNGWPAGWVQDFHLGDPIRWKFDMSELSSGARAEWKSYRNSEAYRLAEQERRNREPEETRIRREEQIAKLNAAWTAYKSAKSVKESPGHPYLLAKHVTPRGGFPVGITWCRLRVGQMISSTGNTLSNLLLIPMMDVTSGKFCALHRVFDWAGADGRYGKGWCTPAGGVYPIGVNAQRGPVFVAEGIATALSVYEVWIDKGKPETPDEHVNQCTVLAAMDSSNLIKQARGIRERYQERRLIVIQDDDEAGAKTANACMGIGFDGVWEFGNQSGVVRNG
jgi:phage/plasmid primase-like uncharacterized protein